MENRTTWDILDRLAQLVVGGGEDEHIQAIYHEVLCLRNSYEGHLQDQSTEIEKLKADVQAHKLVIKQHKELIEDYAAKLSKAHSDNADSLRR